jgi:hypothetical protein
MDASVSATSFRAWSVAEPKLTPAARLEWALELAEEYFEGALPAVIYVHPLTAAETEVSVGIALVSRPEVGRFGYWFPVNQKQGG